MYAIVDIAGQQFKVEKGQKIYVHRLDSEEGKKVDFEKVLLIDDEGKITIGEPVIDGAFVEAKVLEHPKGDKVIVFKKKRRKGYKVKNGHRQSFSKVEILSVNATGYVKKAAKAAAPKTQKPKAEAKAETKEEPKAETVTPAPAATAETPADEPAPARPARAYNDPREIKRRQREAELKKQGVMSNSNARQDNTDGSSSK